MNLLTNDVYATASQLIIDLVYASFNQNRDDARFVASNNMAVSAELYQVLRGFDADEVRKAAAEDRDFCSRCRALGHRLAMVPEAVVGHAHHLSLRKFWRQHFAYGQGALHYHRLQARRGAGRLRDETGLHTQLYRWLLGPLSKLAFGRAASVVLLLVVWQMANAAGFFV